MAAVARGGRASVLGLLSRGEAARGCAGDAADHCCDDISPEKEKGESEWPLNSMAAELNGPRLEPPGGQAKRLVVFLHGYGADGNDLIDIGRAWQSLLPDTAFVSPHAPEPCGQAPTGRQWFNLTFRTPNERWDGARKAAPVLERFLDA